MVMINVIDEVGAPNCITSVAGGKVLAKIEEEFGKGSKVQLSFKGVNILTTAFLNTAVGKLYGSFKPQQIKDDLSFSDLDPYDEYLLERVQSVADQFYNNGGQQGIQKSISDILDE